MYKVNGNLVLASSSPRRKQMLSELELPFTVVVSNIDETQQPNETPKELVQRLATAKAEAVAEQNPSAWVIGADTDVSLNGKIFGKPANEKEAAEMLGLLQGNTHEVWGAFAVINREKKISRVFCDCTRVTMMSVPPELRTRYAATKESLDKAGGYALQGIGGHFVEKMDGSFSTVVGLNCCALVQVLREVGAIS